MKRELPKALEILYKFEGHDISESIKELRSTSSYSKLNWFLIQYANKDFLTSFFEYIENNFYDVIFVNGYTPEYTGAVWINEYRNLYKSTGDDFTVIEANFYHNESEFDTIFIGINHSSRITDLRQFNSKFKTYTGNTEFKANKFVEKCRAFLKDRNLA